jgi:hypothetical protein
VQDGLLLLAAAAAVSEVVGEGEVVAVVVVVLILTKWRGVDRRVAVPQLRTRNVGGALLVPASEASKGERRRVTCGRVSSFPSCRLFEREKSTRPPRRRRRLTRQLGSAINQPSSAISAISQHARRKTVGTRKREQHQPTADADPTSPPLPWKHTAVVVVAGLRLDQPTHLSWRTQNASQRRPGLSDFRAQDDHAIVSRAMLPSDTCTG